jgi:hypothetical protein
MSARFPTAPVYRDRMDFSTILLWAAVPIFLGVAVQGLFAPQRILVPLGGKLDTPSVANEIRANYGGMHLGMAALMGLGAMKPAWHTPMLALLFTFTTGLCVGRALSLAVDGKPNRYLVFFWFLEAVGAVAAGVALFR